MNLNKSILWITVDSEESKHLFISATKIQDKNLSVIQYITGQAIKCKKALDIKLKSRRKTDPELRTQVRIETDDLEILQNYMMLGTYPYFRPLNMKVVDPCNELLPITVEG